METFLGLERDPKTGQIMFISIEQYYELLEKEYMLLEHLDSSLVQKSNDSFFFDYTSIYLTGRMLFDRHLVTTTLNKLHAFTRGLGKDSRICTVPVIRMDNNFESKKTTIENLINAVRNEQYDHLFFYQYTGQCTGEFRFLLELTLIMMQKAELENLKSIEPNEALKIIDEKLFEFKYKAKQNQQVSFLEGAYDKEEIELLTLLEERLKAKVQKDIPKQLTKSEILEPRLNEYGFFEVEKVKILKPEKQIELVKLIAENKHPYQIAMIHFLGFLEYSNKNHFTTKRKLYAEISKIFEEKERTTKGNILVLSEQSKENRNRYTSHQHEEKVKNDYQKLI